MFFFSFSECALPVYYISNPVSILGTMLGPYAARFCAFRLFCCGVNRSFSSLLLRPTTVSSAGISASVAVIPFESPSGMDNIES